MRRLPPSFYDRDTILVARELLGKYLVHVSGGVERIGRIVEVEAYLGPHDLAAHSSKGLTARTKVMFGPPGHAYVYFIYGMYFCMNVVCQPAGVPEAVLLRALEPLEGIELMRRRRGVPDGPEWRLCRGPGVLCRALGITRAENGADLVRGPLRILDAPPVPAAQVARTARIGVAYAGADAARPWRFVVRGSPAVSGRRVVPA